MGDTGVLYETKNQQKKYLSSFAILEEIKNKKEGIKSKTLYVHFYSSRESEISMSEQVVYIDSMIWIYSFLNIFKCKDK